MVVTKTIYNYLTSKVVSYNYLYESS